MATATRRGKTRTDEITLDELRRMAGDIGEDKLLAILDLRPSVAEVEQAIFWVEGSGDMVDRAGHPLTGVAAEIFEILMPEEEEPPPARQ